MTPQRDLCTHSKQSVAPPSEPRRVLSRTAAFSALSTLVARIADHAAIEAELIRWACPVPSFGDFSRTQVASLGLNPSNREFVDQHGNELHDGQRRFHTLASLNLQSWAEADSSDLCRILDACFDYFTGRPYDRWFKKLDYIISGTGTSFYDPERPACHLDVIPYATSRKWAHLGSRQRGQLLALSHDTLGLLLRHSSVRVLILNGQSVVAQFEEATGVSLERQEMADWSLPRRSGNNVRGIAYHGVIDSICGYRLPQNLRVLGYNHNVQSSFGVTRLVVGAIRQWIADAVQDAIT